MIKTLSKWDFVNEFQQWDSRKDQFSRQALEAIFDWYEGLGEDIELDVVGICCEWVEYDSAIDAVNDYDFQFSDYDDKDGDNPLDDEEREAEALEYLEGNTTVIVLDNGGIVLMQF